MNRSSGENAPVESNSRSQIDRLDSRIDWSRLASALSCGISSWPTRRSISRPPQGGIRCVGWPSVAVKIELTLAFHRQLTRELPDSLASIVKGQLRWEL